MARGSNSEARPIIIRRVKKVAAAHHGGAWKVAYADFVTAMMAFFMLLWLISTPDKEKLKGLAQYFSPSADSSQSATTSSAGNTPGLGGRTRRAQSDSTTTAGQPTMEAATNGSSRGGTANIPDASMRVLAEELKIALQSVDAQANQNNVKVAPSRDGVRINLMDTANRSMFKTGTAQLNGYALEMIAQIVRKIAKLGVQVAIEGHTDASGGNGDSNWMLSGQRALSARSAMIAAGLPQDRISEAVALGASQPVYPDQPDRPENRRITFVILAEPSALPSDVSFKF